MDKLRGIVRGNGLEKKFSNKEPHLRWYLEREEAHNPDMGRYYFAFVGTKTQIRDAKNKMYETMAEFGGSTDSVRHDEGRVAETSLGYELDIVESRTAPHIVRGVDIGMPKVEDKKMYERVRKSYTRKSDGVGQEFSIERYIADFYNK